jgi:NCS1 family nucleobase:cation symporter-1
MGALGGILIADYWVVRRQKLNLRDLFELQGEYTYSDGTNWRAVTALVVSILPVVPGFIRAAMTPGGQVPNPNFLDTLYTYAWFVTFILSFVLYLALMKRKA